MEVLLVVAILSVIMGMALYAMNAAQVSFDLTLANNSLQSEVRRTIGWIVKDVRQAVSWEIADDANTPTLGHIKFRQVIDWNYASVPPSFSFSDYYIEYTYNAIERTIIRRTSNYLTGATIKVWILSNVIESPFFTRNTSGTIVPLNKSDLTTSQELVIFIKGQSSALGLQDGYSLTEEVQIRNG